MSRDDAPLTVTALGGADGVTVTVVATFGHPRAVIYRAPGGDEVRLSVAGARTLARLLLAYIDTEPGAPP